MRRTVRGVSSRHQVRMACKPPPAAYAVSSAMMVIVSRSSAAHRARSRVNAAAKASARAKIAHAVAASRAFLRRLYHVERDMPSASHGCLAGRLGPMPCARRQRSERKRAFSRRSASVCFVRNIFAGLRVKKSPPVFELRPQRGPNIQHVARSPRRSLKKGELYHYDMFLICFCYFSAFCSRE
jgi:hypothetical protein